MVSAHRDGKCVSHGPDPDQTYYRLMRSTLASEALESADTAALPFLCGSLTEERRRNEKASPPLFGGELTFLKEAKFAVKTSSNKLAQEECIKFANKYDTHTHTHRGSRCHHGDATSCTRRSMPAIECGANTGKKKKNKKRTRHLICSSLTC